MFSGLIMFVCLSPSAGNWVKNNHVASTYGGNHFSLIVSIKTSYKMFNSKHSPPLSFNKSVFTYLRAPISYQASYFRGLHLRMKTSSYKPTNQVQLCPITSFYFKLNCYSKSV